MHTVYRTHHHLGTVPANNRCTHRSHSSITLFPSTTWQPVATPMASCVTPAEPGCMHRNVVRHAASDKQRVSASDLPKPHPKAMKTLEKIKLQVGVFAGNCACNHACKFTLANSHCQTHTAKLMLANSHC